MEIIINEYEWKLDESRREKLSVSELLGSKNKNINALWLERREVGLIY